MDIELDDSAVRTLALRQPVANDLREVIAALKISGELERIGDYAKNVAKRTMVLNPLAPHESARSIPRMAKLVQAIIKDVPDAYATNDPDRAINVWHRTGEVDKMYTVCFHRPPPNHMNDTRT